MDETPTPSSERVPVINLSNAPGERQLWNKPIWMILLWSVVELVLVTNPWQVSSRIRIAALRAFGGRIGANVIFRPRTKVKFPWNLEIGDRSWIGEGVWFHNQATISIGSDVVVSQETFLTTGSHRHRKDMGLVSRGIRIDDGTWITSRCMVLGGTSMGRSALAQPMTVIRGTIDSNTVVAGPACAVVGTRFMV